jgi:ATP-dependent exoDNAse (exonuclease V) beta subunit
MNSTSAEIVRKPADAAVRQAAIDYRRSFIVQAPAGSGKTELLIQRFLNLLGNAEIAEPEAILAITFTRKAANEMRNRILGALDQAASGGGSGDGNSKLTEQLASAALRRDRQRRWAILENPGRLQVRTVDSFCESVTRQMPILSRFSAGAKVSEDCAALYQQAAQWTLRLLAHPTASIASAVESLQRHLDNNLQRAELLLMEMLKRRDQWLPLLGRCDQYNAAELTRFREELEASLRHAVGVELAEIRNRVQAALGARREEFVRLARYAARNLQTSAPESRAALLCSIEDLPGEDPAEVKLWLGLRDFFLNKSGKPWSRLTVKNGFPPLLECREHKERCEELFAWLGDGAAAEGLRAALGRLEFLPPVTYTGEQWECVRALLVVLPLAAAELKVVFAERGTCDFIEVSEAALAALEPSEPSQLALSLGCRIQHVLVDEFQDTSVAQVELLRRLTAEWANGDGSTLFLVGDPMQSIYGFRKAEVGLFEDARCGRAGLPALEPRELFVNFRSTAPLVGWYNRVFGEVLRESNRATGAVKYNPAEAAQLDRGCRSELDGVHLHGVEDRESEGACVADIVKRTRQQRPADHIAILVRARTHLPEIVRALQAAEIRFRAVDIEPLGQSQAVRDLHALTLAITQPADRVAWLALLRSPVCGLALPDLLELCRDDDRATVMQLLPLRSSHLSENARRRGERLFAVLSDAIALRGRRGLREIVERTWIVLGGPASSVNIDQDLSDGAAYLDLLQQSEAGGELVDADAFQKNLEQLFAPTETEIPGAVEIMTIHGAKGLQWDTVILPALGRSTRHEAEQLLYWRESVSEGQAHLLLAPIDSAANASLDTGVEKYLKRISADRGREELKRLLYVACTRARTALHLVAELPEADKEPDRGSMLALLWPARGLGPEFEPFHGSIGGVTQPRIPPSVLRRLPLDWRQPAPPPALHWQSRDELAGKLEPQSHTFDWASQRLQKVGTAAHRLLQQIGREGVESWDVGRIRRHAGAIRNLLIELGVAADEMDEAADLVRRALENALSDPQGRWILGAHPDAACELELSALIDNSVVRVKLDRTFLDEQGTRWIVDYKTSEIGSGNTAAFIDAQVEKFRPDLYRYRTVMASLEPNPIRMALYFPLLRQWREVS